ncbi:transmembrane protein 41B-like [Penaeus chinensis]|uniref:transmembrane protein 41B-like n=1 Tax=Penaeus chinensis TaxID=139456 RepID=UPI001FB68CD9|nr:transmembrane protein 41B-like [Penaeus chinensis]
MSTPVHEETPNSTPESGSPRADSSTLFIGEQDEEEATCHTRTNAGDADEGNDTALIPPHACSVIPASLQETPASEASCLDLKRTCVLLLVAAEAGIPEVDLGDFPTSKLQEEEREEKKGEGETSAVPMRSRVDVHTVVLEGFSEMSQTKGERGAAEKAEGMDTQRALLSLVAIFLVSFSALAFVYTNFPQMDPEEYQYIKLPTDIEDAKNLGRVLSHYKNRYYLEVLAGVFVTYIFLQTFAIPGSIFLSILSGFLFRWEIALLLICFCSATGASFCYLLSYLAGRPAVLKYMPERTKSWQEKVDKQRDNLLFYIIFLRITPFLPNWFINITSPVINVPLMPFWFGTFLGVAPPSILAVQAGTTLYELTSSRDAFSLTSVVLLGLAACLSLVPILLKNRLREKFD